MLMIMSAKLHLRHKQTNGQRHVRLLVCLSIVHVSSVHPVRGMKRDAS